MNEFVSAKVDPRESILQDKPILVTLNNPSQTIGPLWPDFEPSPGWRLWQMMAEYTGASKAQFLRIFERHAVMDKSAYDWEYSQTKVQDTLQKLQGRSRVVFVGYDVLVGLGIRKRKMDYKWRYDYGFTYTAIPFPSSSSREYRWSVNVALVGILLADLYVEALQKRRAVIPLQHANISPIS